MKCEPGGGLGGEGQGCGGSGDSGGKGPEVLSKSQMFSGCARSRDSEQGEGQPEAASCVQRTSGF